MCQSIEETSFFNETEDIWDDIAHILRKVWPLFGRLEIIWLLILQVARPRASIFLRGTRYSPAYLGLIIIWLIVSYCSCAATFVRRTCIEIIDFYLFLGTTATRESLIILPEWKL